MHLFGLDISSPRRLTAPNKDKSCPNPSDIKVAREFLVSLGVENKRIMYIYSQGLKKVVRWMKVKFCTLCKRIDIKSEAGIP
jgi:hypothetical protein